MSEELLEQEQGLNKEGLNVVVSHSMGYDSYNREKLFDSMSLNGILKTSHDFRLVTYAQELYKVFITLNNYRYLKDIEMLVAPNDALRMTYVVDGETVKPKNVTEANELEFQKRASLINKVLERLANRLQDFSEDEDLDEDDNELLGKLMDIFVFINSDILK